MTIAIGIMARDALVVAADTQESIGYPGSIKSDEHKVKTYGFQDVGTKSGDRTYCAIAGAGDAGYIDALTQQLGQTFMDDVHKERGEQQGRLNDKLQLTIREFYRDHMIPFLALPANERPAVELLLGIVPLTGSPQLLVTSNDTIRRGHGFAAIGAGATFAKVLLSKFWRFEGVREAEVFAAYVVYAVKEIVEGCGNYTTVVSLRARESATKPPGIDYLPATEVARLEALFHGSHKRAEQKTLWRLIDREAKRTDSRKAAVPRG